LLANNVKHKPMHNFIENHPERLSLDTLRAFNFLNSFLNRANGPREGRGQRLGDFSGSPAERLQHTHLFVAAALVTVMCLEVPLELKLYHVPPDAWNRAQERGVEIAASLGQFRGEKGTLDLDQLPELGGETTPAVVVAQAMHRALSERDHPAQWLMSDAVFALQYAAQTGNPAA
jgi:hypothetical protein